MKPGPEGIVNPEPSSLAEEHQERRLEGVLCIMGIAEQRGADAEDHRPMPLNQSRECGLGQVGFAGREAFEQLPVRQVADRAQLIKGAKLPGREIMPPDGHVRLSSLPGVPRVISSA
jgi:hypothetical protein